MKKVGAFDFKIVKEKFFNHFRRLNDDYDFLVN